MPSPAEKIESIMSTLKINNSSTLPKKFIMTFKNKLACIISKRINDYFITCTYSNFFFKWQPSF